MDTPNKRMKKGECPLAPKPTPTKESALSIQEFRAWLYEQARAKRGGSGFAAKLNPAPRTPHKPKQKVQVVCR